MKDDEDMVYKLQKDGSITKDGHTMFPEDVVKDLNRACLATNPVCNEGNPFWNEDNPFWRLWNHPLGFLFTFILASFGSFLMVKLMSYW